MATGKRIDVRAIARGAAMQRGAADNRGMSAFRNVDNLKQALDAPRGTEVVEEIPLASIQPDPNQVRKTFNDAELAELAASLRASNGNIVPVILRKLGESAIDGYEIVAGERRWRAAKLAGLLTLRCIVRAMTPELVLLYQFIENDEATRVSVPPYEEALHLQRLKVELGYKQEQIATLLGKSQAVISQRMALLELPDEVQVALKDGLLVDTVTARNLGTVWAANAARGKAMLKAFLAKELGRDEVAQAVAALSGVPKEGVATPRRGRQPNQLPDWLSEAASAAGGADKLSASFSPARTEGGKVKITLVGTEDTLRALLKLKHQA